MTTRPSTRLLGALALAALLAACGSTTDLKEKAPVETRKPTTTTSTAPAAGSGGGSAVTPIAQRSTGVETAGTASMSAAVPSPAQRIVYFDFDSFVIKDEFKPVIEGHARALTAARNRKLVVEGHTDERGGSEYNLALGQKRAEAVVRSLALLGVADNQMEAVSFGKERPADSGHDEAAWAKNRRAELKDK